MPPALSACASERNKCPCRRCRRLYETAYPANFACKLDHIAGQHFKKWYETGAISRPDKMQKWVIEEKVAAKEHKKEFEISRISRFRYRPRYCSDLGIIGSKELVAENYQRFKHLYYSKYEKRPKPIKGLEGMYSLKRLSELI